MTEQGGPPPRRLLGPRSADAQGEVGVCDLCALRLAVAVDFDDLWIWRNLSR